MFGIWATKNQLTSFWCIRVPGGKTNVTQGSCSAFQWKVLASLHNECAITCVTAAHHHFIMVPLLHEQSRWHFPSFLLQKLLWCNRYLKTVCGKCFIDMGTPMQEVRNFKSSVSASWQFFDSTQCQPVALKYLLTRLHHHSTHTCHHEQCQNQGWWQHMKMVKGWYEPARIFCHLSSWVILHVVSTTKTPTNCPKSGTTHHCEV